MKVAIIEDNPDYQEILKTKIEEFNKNSKHEKVNVDFFFDSKGFGESDLSQYNVIISNVYLPHLKGTDLLEAIKTKTDAHLALMSSKNGWVSDKIMNDKRIRTFLDKKNPDRIVEWLEFMQSRLILDEYNIQVKTSYAECVMGLNSIKN
jgi:CheY-like chemotaxis protein